MRISGSRIRLVAKILVSLGLLVFLLVKISFSELVGLFESLDIGVIVGAMSVFLLSNIIGSLQWHLLLKSSGVQILFHKTIRVYFIGLFFNNFLPANIGGDAVKVYDVSKVGNSVYQVVAVTLLDRIIGIFSLCLLACVAVLTFVKTPPIDNLWLYFVIFVGCMTPVLGFYFVKPLGQILRWLVGTLRPLSWDKGGSSILDYLGEFKARKPLILQLILISVVIQSLRVFTHILVAISLGIAIAPTVIGLFFVFVPLLSLAMIPPITINGLGIREGLGILLFSQAGIGQTDAFAIEFLTYVVSVSVSLLGLVSFLTRGVTRKRPKDDMTVS
jgi:uncharacterized protein (TIRG00374 family)